MKLNNLQLDILQEALIVMLRDKYAMPPHMKEFKNKYALIVDLHDLLEEERTDGTSNA